MFVPQSPSGDCAGVFSDRGSLRGYGIEKHIIALRRPGNLRWLLNPANDIGETSENYLAAKPLSGICRQKLRSFATALSLVFAAIQISSDEMQNEASTSTEAGKSETRTLALAMIPVGIAINLAIGTLVSILKLPLFIDATGTILVTLLLGIRAGVITGMLSFLIGGLLVNPAMPWFCGTQAAIAVYIGLMARAGLFRSFRRVVLCGIGLGIVAATVSAPVIVKLFGGITGSGSGVITAFFLATGKSIIKSVFLTGVSCEPVDKTMQCLLAFWLIRSLPKNLLSRFAGRGYVEKNGFLP